MDNKRDRAVLAVLFAVFLLINGILVIIHEPWRDEIHAWLMSRYMTIPEMISFSRYEAHPLLWHFMLIPLAKLGAPIWTMNLLSYLITGASAFIFVFKTKLNTIVKAAVLFTIPFIYTYSSVARNYTLILLFGMIIAAMYGKRHEHPFLFSIPIALMVFTHAMAWGFVAGVTITFHIFELARVILKKNTLERKTVISMLSGLVLIAASTVFVVVTLYGSDTPGLYVAPNDETDKIVLAMIILMGAVIGYAVYRRGTVWKEAFTFFASLSFMIVIYRTVYSGVIFQRLILIQVFLLIFVICVHDTNKIPNIAAAAVYFLSFLITGALFDTFYYVSEDIRSNYSSAQEMAAYINTNLPSEKVILVDAGIFAQTMVPYTDKELYDIRYQANIEDSLYCVNEPEKIMDAIFDIPNHEEYRGKYLILYYAMEGAPFDVVYRTSDSVTGENYTLYYIP